MWTPRRVLLLLLGLLLFAGAYGGYYRVLGWLDGLPQLPARMLIPGDGKVRPPERTISPTVQRLIEAFGPDCPEQDDQNYPTKFEFRTPGSESSTVLAAGSTPLSTGAKSIVLAPFSLAVFGKPRPAHLRQPGEVVEITTFHADKAELEFDRVISTPNDMNKARLLRMQLVSEPERTLPDPRRGIVHITNNQRSADPSKSLVLRTPGPVFYRDPKNSPAGDTGPDIWSDAAVEIIDRQNLPRPYGAPSPPTTPTRGQELREASAVPDILAGRRLPPPTVSAIGMKVFLEPDTRPGDPKQPRPAKKGSAGFSGVSRIELRERVLINLWVDARQGLVSGQTTPGSKTTDKPASASPLAVPEPPPATAALTGAMFFATQTARQLDRALLQIETLGPFTYDAEKNIAHFDVLPLANPNLPNDVQVTKIPPRGGHQKLFSQVLEIEFNGPPAGGSAGAAAPPPGSKAATNAGPSFKQLHAWTYTPGRYLTVAAEDEQLTAYGYDLVHDQAANRTVLLGAQLFVIRERNILTAGGPQRPAALVMEPDPEKKDGAAADRKTVATVRGAGRMELYDSASDGNTITAVWQTSLTHQKEMIGGRELDRLTFTDGAMFEDRKADYWLKGKVLRLWIESAKKDESPAARKDEKAEGSGQPLPHRLQAIGDVSSHSADFDILQAEQLNVLFRDGQPPPPPKRVPDPIPAAPVAAPKEPANPATPPAPKEEPKEPPKEKTKPPMKLRARVIDTWVVRYPVIKPDTKVDPKAASKAVAKAAAKPGPAGKPTETTLKYDLEKARCQGQVIAHQDPDDPQKPRGTDIRGEALLIDHLPQGSVMTVTGGDREPAEVHHESMSILGPKVFIDQVHNLATVEGRGALSMPAGSDLTGAELKQAEVIVVHWRDGMTFSGSTKLAEFVGKVTAQQGESWVVCHTLQVVLDRQVYFTQVRKPVATATPKPPADPKGPRKPEDKDSPKVSVVRCYPAPEDAPDEPRGSNTVTFNQVERDPKTGRVSKSQQITAREMTVNADAQDPLRGEKYQLVIADGPGVVRTWQPGAKDMSAGAETQPQPQAQPGAPKPKQKEKEPEPETEMKLTVIKFGSRMRIKDKAKVYQEAVFHDTIQVINAPADDPAADVSLYKLPLRSMVLTCAESLTVATHKKAGGPPVQSMVAVGNASIKSDEYVGWGELVTYDGQFVVLEGGGKNLARILSRFKGNEDAGKKIKYNRATKDYEVIGGFGGTIQTPAPAPQPAPPPKAPGPGAIPPKR